MVGYRCFVLGRVIVFYLEAYVLLILMPRKGLICYRGDCFVEVVFFSW